MKKSNFNIVLTAEWHKFMLIEAYPNDPTANASEGVRQRFDEQKKSNQMAKCYIFTSVSNVIQHQLQDVDHAANMITILKEIFGEQSRAAK